MPLPSRRTVLLVLAVLGSGAAFTLYRKYRPQIEQIQSELALVRQLLSDPSPASTLTPLIQRFLHNLRVGSFTCEKFALELRESIKVQFPIEVIRKKIQRIKESQTHEKESTGTGTAANTELVSAWRTFILSGFSRSLVGMYSLAFLQPLVHLQLAIIGRYVSEAGAAAAAAPQAGLGAAAASGSPSPLPAPLLDELNRAFFSLSRHLLTSGLRVIQREISGAVEEELIEFRLDERLSLQQLEQRLQAIDRRILARLTPRLSQALFPTPSVIRQFLQDTKFGPSHAMPMQNPFQPPNSSSSASSAVPPNLNSDFASLAARRLSSMCGEFYALLHSSSFRSVIDESIQFHQQKMIEYLRTSLGLGSGSGSAPESAAFVTSAVKFMKSFDYLFPDHSAAAFPVSSHQPVNQSSLIQLAAIVYFPMEDNGKTKADFKAIQDAMSGKAGDSASGNEQGTGAARPGDSDPASNLIRALGALPSSRMQ